MVLYEKRVCGSRGSVRILPLPQIQLALALTACGLLQLGLVLAASSGAGRLGGGLLTCCALDLLALLGVSDALGVCH